MSGKYASGTSVSIASSVEEIQAIVERYGASAFGYATEDSPQGGRAMVTFIAHGRQVRMGVALPSRTSREFTHTPARGDPRSDKAARAAWEQACRQRWRALVLLVKALLEAVESGIVTFEEVMLSWTVLPGTTMTVSERIGADMETAIEVGTTPRLALGPG